MPFKYSSLVNYFIKSICMLFYFYNKSIFIFLKIKQFIVFLKTQLNFFGLNSIDKNII